MHRAELIFAADQKLFGIAHASAALQIGQAAVAQSEQEKTHLIEAARAVVGDVSAAPRVDDVARLARMGGEVFGCPVGEERKDETVPPHHLVDVQQDTIDVGAFHGASPSVRTPSASKRCTSPGWAVIRIGSPGARSVSPARRIVT